MEDKKELVDKVSAFIFDCDGVIWRGDSVIDGVPETLDWLRAQVCIRESRGLCQGLLMLNPWSRQRPTHPSPQKSPA